MAKLEFLACVCYLLSSLYNYNVSRQCWPYWASIFASTAAFFGFTTKPAVIAQAMYTLGLDGVSIPSYVPWWAFVPPTFEEKGESLGSVVFILAWTVLPFLYVLYFAACAKLAENSYGTRMQQALCLICIFHFLFLTDIVDYGFGRGIVNPAAEWCHWVERFAWRIAILLPIYQNLATGHWRRGNGIVGVVLHYSLAVWATGFLIYAVLLYDVPRFYRFAFTGEAEYYHELFGLSYRQELGYYGALVLMTFVYGFNVLALRCKRIVVTLALPDRNPQTAYQHRPRTVVIAPSATV